MFPSDSQLKRDSFSGWVTVYRMERKSRTVTAYHLDLDDAKPLDPGAGGVIVERLRIEEWPRVGVSSIRVSEFTPVEAALTEYGKNVAFDVDRLGPELDARGLELSEAEFWRILQPLVIEGSLGGTGEVIASLAREPDETILGFQEMLCRKLFEVDDPRFAEPWEGSSASSMSIRLRFFALVLGRSRFEAVVAGDGLVPNTISGQAAFLVMDMASGAWAAKHRTDRPRIQTTYSTHTGSNSQRWTPQEYEARKMWPPHIDHDLPDVQGIAAYPSMSQVMLQEFGYEWMAARTLQYGDEGTAAQWLTLMTVPVFLPREHLFDYLFDQLDPDRRGRIVPLTAELHVVSPRHSMFPNGNTLCFVDTRRRPAPRQGRSSRPVTTADREASFWTLIDVLGGRADDKSVLLLFDALAELPKTQIRAFRKQLDSHLKQLDTPTHWDWLAEHDPTGLPPSDDSFAYACASTIAAGRSQFEAAVASGTLPNHEDDPGAAEMLLSAAEDALRGD